MHRLVIELPIRQFGIDDLNRTLDNVKSYTVLHRLKQDQSGYVAISRIELKSSNRSLHDLTGRTGITEIKSIYRESNETHIALVTFKPVGWIAEAFHFPNVYPIGPLEIRDEKVRTGFVGKSYPQISRKDGKGKSEIQDSLAYGCEVFP